MITLTRGAKPTFGNWYTLGISAEAVNSDIYIGISSGNEAKIRPELTSIQTFITLSDTILGLSFTSGGPYSYEIEDDIYVYRYVFIEE